MDRNVGCNKTRTPPPPVGTIAMFARFFDLIFLRLACFTAFKIGASGMADEE
jgi:hypothetical protein